MAEKVEGEEAVGELKVNCTAADNVNVAFYQNAVPIVREVAIENNTGRDLSELSVHLTAEPAFLTPGVWRIQRVSSGLPRTTDIFASSRYVANGPCPEVT